MATPLVDPALFEALQAKLDDDTAARDALKDTTHALEKQLRKLLAHIAAAQSLPPATQASTLAALAAGPFAAARATLATLAATAQPHPYYKFNGLWARSVQDAALAALLLAWLGALPDAARAGELAPLDRVAASLGVPGPGDGAARDGFHLATEEYLHALVGLVEELARLARTAVTMGDYARPLGIARFVKDVHAGFGVLNLKNDALRKRGDGIKYKVRETEDVVYDLTLRGVRTNYGRLNALHRTGSVLFRRLDALFYVQLYAIIILLLAIVDNVVEAELVVASAGADDAQPVAQLLLLQVLLGEVLEVAAGELLVGNNLDLAAVGALRDLDGIAQVAGAAVDLDAVVEKLLKGRDVEDLVVGGLRGVDGELVGELAWSLTKILGAQNGCIMYKEEIETYLLGHLAALLDASSALGGFTSRGFLEDRILAYCHAAKQCISPTAHSRR
ncbi:hypothetical protein FH972_021707 [Carpinus fangiana]|uniref:Translin n=1 Tax=Carpinus fangiana TaxID=176857 RepID=A0A5N6KQ33_9ROSI|nr:hypothetical protein FH972_021707 [Carpinus fangiana]